jgi:hypothetical protein
MTFLHVLVRDRVGTARPRLVAQTLRACFQRHRPLTKLPRYCFGMETTIPGNEAWRN